MATEITEHASPIVAVDDQMLADLFGQTPHGVAYIDTREILFNSVDLRDGIQGQPVTATLEQRIAFAQQLHAMGLSGIEAGNAPAGQQDVDAIEGIASAVGTMDVPGRPGRKPRISSLTCLIRGQIDAALESVSGAPNRGVHVYISLSEIQFPFKFATLRTLHGLNVQDYGRFLTEVVYPSIETEFAHIKSTDPDCHLRYSPEDWTRTRLDVADEVILCAARNGADCINLPDTLGVGNPFVLVHAVARVRTLLDSHGFEHVQIAIHTHNDGDLATANAFAAVLGGADEIDTTVIGAGERAGNVAIEGVIATLRLQRDFMERVLRSNITDSIVDAELAKTAHMAQKIFGMNVPEKHPIVGRQVSVQGAGVHQAAHAAGLKAGVATVYQPFDLKRFGVEHVFVVRPESGWGGLMQVFDKIGLPYRTQDRQVFSERHKQVCQTHPNDLTEEEVADLIYFPVIEEIVGGSPHIVRIEKVADTASCKTVILHDRGSTQTTGIASDADRGYVDAVVQAMRQINPTIDIPADGMRIGNVDSGAGGHARATVTVKNGSTVTRTAIDTDTTIATEQALLHAFNSLCALDRYRVLCGEA